MAKEQGKGSKKLPFTGKGEQMKDIELLPTKYHKFPFRISNAVIRTDGRYCDCTLTFESSKGSNHEETSGIIGMQIMATNMQALEIMLQNICKIYAPKKQRKVPVMEINSVLKNRIGKLALKTADKHANSPIQPQKES